MSHYKPYPAYKDSGVEGIGKVPAHWTESRLKFMGEYLNGHPFKPEEWGKRGLPIIRIAQLTGQPFDNYFEGGAPAHLRVKNGDLLFSWSATIDCFIWERGDAWLNQHIFKVVPSAEADKRFLFHLLRHVTPKLADFDAHGSTMRHIKKESLSEKVFIPSIQEQAAIAKVIDSETTRIDALIAKKTEFIGLLAKKRQALITHAVTKGLNPKAKMKDSGVEWIGEVPEHWEIRRMATLFREAIRPGDPDLPILSISIHDGITDDELAPEDRDRRVSQIEDRTKYKRVAPGDLAYNMMRAWQGAFGAVTVDGLVSPAYVVAEPTDDFYTGYIEHLLRTPMAIEEMRRYSRGIADFRMRLYWDYFRDLKVCLPPKDEQDAILARIGKETRRIDLLNEKTQHSIDLLKKRRSAFITAAVTGQIDLRESA